MALRVLDTSSGERVRSVCEAIVPGSGAIWPEVYVDALLAGMGEQERGEALADFEEAAGALERDGATALGASAGFTCVRALAIEAYYSDFVAPGAADSGAWRRIGFEFPLSEQVRKDWSYLGVGDG